MFEIGKTYRLEWIEGSDHHYQSGEALAWEAPLLKVRLPGGDRIINTAGSTFVSATEGTSITPEERAEQFKKAWS